MYSDRRLYTESSILNMREPILIRFLNDAKRGKFQDELISDIDTVETLKKYLDGQETPWNNVLDALRKKASKENWDDVNNYIFNTGSVYLITQHAKEITCIPRSVKLLLVLMRRSASFDASGLPFTVRYFVKSVDTRVELDADAVTHIQRNVFEHFDFFKINVIREYCKKYKCSPMIMLVATCDWKTMITVSRTIHEPVTRNIFKNKATLSLDSVKAIVHLVSRPL